MDQIFIALICKMRSLTAEFIFAELFDITTFSHFWCDLYCACIWLCFAAEMLCLVAVCPSLSQNLGFLHFGRPYGHFCLCIPRV